MKKLLLLAAILPLLVSVPRVFAETEYVALPESILIKAFKEAGDDMDLNAVAEYVGNASAGILNEWRLKNIDKSFVSVAPDISHDGNISTSVLHGFLVTYRIREKNDARPAFEKVTYVPLHSQKGPGKASLAQKLSQWEKGNASTPLVSVSMNVRLQSISDRSEIVGCWVISQVQGVPESQIASK